MSYGKQLGERSQEMIGTISSTSNNKNKNKIQLKYKGSMDVYKYPGTKIDLSQQKKNVTERMRRYWEETRCAKQATHVHDGSLQNITRRLVLYY